MGQTQTHAYANIIDMEVVRMKEASRSCSDLDQPVACKMEDDECFSPGHLIYSLRQQLIEKDNAIKRLGSEYDHNLSKVLSSLLFLEGKLHREQKHIVRLIEQKDTVITQQEEQIKQLCKRIQILQSSITDIQSRMDSNGINQSLQENCVPSTETPVLRTQPGRKYFTTSELSLSSSSLNQSSEGGNIFRNLSKPLREKFSRNKSNVDLRSFKRINGDELCYRSMENIPQVVRREKKPRDKERCMSIAGYPNYEDFQNDPELTAFMKQIQFDNNPPSNPSLPTVDCQSLSSTLPNSLSISSSASLRNRTDDLLSANIHHTKESSRSLSNLQFSKSKSDLPQKKAAPAEISAPTTTTVHHSESSNPFKLIRDTLKRKGSKQVKNKKQSFSLLQNSNQDLMKSLKFCEPHGKS